MKKLLKFIKPKFFYSSFDFSKDFDSFFELSDDFDSFKLPDDFVESYRDINPNFGFNGLGEVVYYRTYSRLMENGENEDWVDTLRRVTEGTFNLQKKNIRNWDEDVAQKSAEIMFDKMFNFKFLPAGRGLYTMGTKLTEEVDLYCALNSCAFVSTKNIDKNCNPFLFVKDLQMLGVGVGFDLQGAGKITIKKPKQPKFVFVIPDDREGWVESVKHLLDSYFYGYYEVVFDYSLVRQAGEPLKTFGGIAAGPGPLREMHENIRNILNDRIGQTITSRDIVDIINIIGKNVSCGNVRRSAGIALGDKDDIPFYYLKDYEVNPERSEYGWTSNNSILAELGMDYSFIADRIKYNGEPGLVWLDNIKGYSRMNGEKDFKDYRAEGCNPCVEQTLESYEMCCLVETFPFHHDNLEEYLDTLKYAFMYGKTVTLGMSHWEETNVILQRNRRIGVSMSGVTQFLKARGKEELIKWCNEGYEAIQEYDILFSNLFEINRSIKTTSIKPSGTISLVAGVTPGIHWPEGNTYIRRLRVAKNSELISILEKAGFNIEPDVDSDYNLIVEFPQKIDNIRTSKEVSMWEKLELAALLQEHWSDNQVSCTVTFDVKEEGTYLENALDEYQYKLKGISFLPVSEIVPFPQMPYEEISEEEFDEQIEGIKRLDFSELESDGEGEKGCSNDTCLFENS
jgi:adenosylcobalamin-dependent ribonucleoside-triphosphate reductase